MVVEALAQIGSLADLEGYRYVGMGSVYFQDFQLVHRRLSINDMISIERASHARDRVLFNRPLACIDVRMGTTGDVLPDLDLENKPHIIWLDYESSVDGDMLADLDETAGRCAPSSMLIVTANADRPRSGRDRWLSSFGHDRPEPREPRTRDEYAQLTYKLLRERIESAVSGRNAAIREPEHRVSFRQTFHVVYNDGAQMLTVGGGLVRESSLSDWTASGIESLPFSRTGDEPYRIAIPKLTLREIHRLLQSLPPGHGDVEQAAATIGIPSSDAKRFAAVYRFASFFVEVEDY